MAQRLFVVLLLISTSLFANKFSGIWGTAGLSFAESRGKDSHYIDYTVIGNDTIATDTLKPSSIKYPIFAIGYEKSLLNFLTFKLGIGYELLGNKFIIEDGIKTELNTSTSKLDTLYTWEHSRTFSFSYFTIPIDLKFKLPLNRSALYSSIGAKLGLLLTAKEKLEQKVTLNGISNPDLPYNLDPISDSYEKNLKEKSSAINMSLGFRLGGEIPIRRLHLLIESGYDIGLIDIMKNEKLVDRSGVLTIIALGLRLNTTSDE